MKGDCTELRYRDLSINPRGPSYIYLLNSRSGIKIAGNPIQNVPWATKWNGPQNLVGRTPSICGLLHDDCFLSMKSNWYQSWYHYCLLAWMFHSRTLNHKIIRTYERLLGIIFSNRRSILKSLLVKDHSFTIYEKKLSITFSLGFQS